MRKLVYQVASSLDGFIADEAGGYDWIVQDDAIDFAELYARFDTFVMGRKTWEVLNAWPDNPIRDQKIVVASRTMADQTGIEIVRDDIIGRTRELKQEEGKAIWLYGGGELFRTCFDAGLVDGVELALIPVLLGGGIPVIAPGRLSPALKLVGLQRYPSGILMASYEVPPATSG